MPKDDPCLIFLGVDLVLLVWLGGEQNRPAPNDDPCSIFFLGVDLVFFKEFF